MTSDINTFIQNIEQFGPLIKVLIAALIVLGGWLISGGIGQIVVALLNKLRLNQILKKMGWEETFSKAEIRLNAPKFFGEIVKWSFVVVFLMIAFEVVGLAQFSNFLGEVVAWLPNLIVAALIFIVAVYLADFTYRIVIASAERAKIRYSKLLGSGIRAAIWVFAILAILLQLGVTPSIVRAIVYGIVAMIALAGGLAFGLGGKDLAQDLLQELRDKIS